jgi:hypothetical protein
MDEIDGAIDMPGNPLDQMIERWWEDHFPGSAVARDRGPQCHRPLLQTPHNFLI